MKIGEGGHKLYEHHERYVKSLRDAIARKSIIGIQEVIELLAEQEKKDGKDLNTNPRGLQYLIKRFKLRVEQIEKLRSLTRKSIIISFIAILTSLFSLVFVENIIHCCIAKYALIVFVLGATLLSAVFTIQGIYEGLKDQDGV